MKPLKHSNLRTDEPAKEVTIQTGKTPEENIISLYESMKSGFMQVVKASLQIGFILSSVKARLDHGQFTEWVKQSEFPFSERQARKYMRSYLYYMKNGTLDSLLEKYEKDDSDFISSYGLKTIDLEIRKAIQKNKGKDSVKLPEKYRKEIESEEMKIKHWKGLIKESQAKINSIKKGYK